MILGSKMTLTDQVLENILRGKTGANEIQNNLQKSGINVTIQGIYKALRELISSDVVLKQEKKYFINNEWRSNIERLVVRQGGKFLCPGDEVKYKFNKIENADVFWKNMFSDIEYEIGKFPAFHFLPHQFFILIKERKQSELDYYNELNKKGISGYTLIGGETAFDISAKEKLTSEFHQSHIDNNTVFNDRDYISVLGDYIIITRIPASFAKEIDRAYKMSRSEEDLTSKIENIFQKKGRLLIIVKNSPEKAKKIRKAISKNFYIPKEVKKDFDIF